jgi:hypothetical protein
VHFAQQKNICPQNTLQTDAFLLSKNYSCVGAPTGQVPLQAPQSMQASASIFALSPSIEIAPTGQPSTQAPQPMHSSLIL